MIDYKQLEYFYPEDYKIFKKLTHKDIDYLQELKIERDKSYLIYSSNKEALQKFVAFYLIVNKILDYESYTVSDFTEGYEHRGRNTSVLILYYSRFTRDSREGNREHIYGRILDTVSSRAINGKVTLLLSESKLEEIENSGEFTKKLLNLNKMSLSLDSSGVQRGSDNALSNDIDGFC